MTTFRLPLIRLLGSVAVLLACCLSAPAASESATIALALDRSAIVQRLAGDRADIAAGLAAAAERWLDASTIFPSRELADNLLRHPVSISASQSAAAFAMDCEQALINLRLDLHGVVQLARHLPNHAAAADSATAMLVWARGILQQRFASDLTATPAFRPMPTDAELRAWVMGIAASPVAVAFKQPLSASASDRLRRDFASQVDRRSASIAEAIRRDVHLAAANRDSVLMQALRDLHKQVAKATTPPELQPERTVEVLPGLAEFRARRDAMRREQILAENASMAARQLAADGRRDARVAADRQRASACAPSRPALIQPAAPATAPGAAATIASQTPLPGPMRWLVAGIVGLAAATATYVLLSLRLRRRTPPK